MFGDMMGNMEEQQKALKQKLSGIILEAQAGDGAIQVKANGNKEILNIAIDKDKIDLTDTDELEDLIIVAVNRAIQAALLKEAEETQTMIQSILPPGMGGLGNLFG